MIFEVALQKFLILLVCSIGGVVASAQITGNPRDSLLEGEYISYYPSGEISSVRTYKIIKKKLSDEYIFLHGGILHDQGDPYDSTLLTSVPIGKWMSYYENGNVKSISFYDDYGKPINIWMNYFPDGRIESTLRYDSLNGLLFVDSYEYRGDLESLIERRRSKGRQISYIIGQEDSLQLDKITLQGIERTGTILKERILVNNLSGKDISVTVNPNQTFSLAQTQFNLTPKDSHYIHLTLRVPKGEIYDKISLSTESWTFDFDVHLTGYDLNRTDFSSVAPKQLPSKFIYYKTSDEYLLEIRNIKNHTIEFIPISKQLNEISVKRGNYSFTLVGPEGRSSIEVHIK